MISFIITEQDPHLTLIAALRKHGVSVTMRRRIKHNGICRINGQLAFWSDFVKTGDAVTVDLPPKNIFEPEEMALDIVYEDEYLLLLNKAPGVLMHPTSGIRTGTLANGLSWYYGQQGQSCSFHPMHRLDKNTSGLVMFAKQPQIQYAFAKKKLFYSRQYLALVTGYFPAPRATVRFPIARDPSSIILRQVSLEGKPAHTDLLRLAACKDYSLLQVNLFTGRTHQIRVHCSFMGYPLVGDDLYGGSRQLFGRQALHACCVQFIHPVTGEPIIVKSPLPEDMQGLISQAGWDDIVSTTLGGMTNAISNH